MVDQLLVHNLAALAGWTCWCRNGIMEDRQRKQPTEFKVPNACCVLNHQRGDLLSGMADAGKGIRKSRIG